jgi:hypothetical protein
MERYNSFNLIHKGLRAALYQTALQLQQTDFTSEEEMEEAVNKVREVVMIFDGHAHKEDTFVLPAIAAYEPSVVASFESEHVEDVQLGEQLNFSIAKVVGSNSLLEKLVSGRELTEAFVRFMVFNLNHMAKEENIINKILWRYYSDDEIKKIVAEIGKNVEPWIQDIYAGWMLRGVNNPEAVNWIMAIEKTAPPVVYQTLLQKAKQELPEERYTKVMQSLVTTETTEAIRA